MPTTAADLEARIAKIERELADPVVEAARSKPLRVRFPAADTPRDIAHGLGDVPTGYRVDWATAPIHATPGLQWTREIAYLQSTVANAEAIITFFVATEAAIDAYT